MKHLKKFEATFQSAEGSGQVPEIPTGRKLRPYMIDNLKPEMGGGLELEPQEEQDYLEGFINKFIGEEAELSNDDWTVSDFLEWLKLNKFKIVKVN